MQVTIEENPLEATAGESCGQVLSRAISGKRLKNSVACLVNGQTRDLSFPLPADARDLAPVAADSPTGLSIIRHSAAHIMAVREKDSFQKLAELAKAKVN